MRIKETTLHITLSISVNRETFPWSDPKGSRNIEFAIPVELFSGNLFSKMVEEKIKEAVQEYKSIPVKSEESEEEEEL